MTTPSDRYHVRRELLRRDRIRRAQQLVVPPLLIEQAGEEFVTLLDALRPPRPA